MNEKDINYEPDIIFVPVHWYYWLLDYKQKRPDYKRITAMAVLGDLYANSADKDGYIEGDFCFDGQNEGGIFLHKEITSLLDKEYINQKSHRIIVDLITGMAGENKEYGYLAGYLLCEFIFFMDEVQSVDSKKSFHSKFPILKESLLKNFNETPQRIRKALEVLKKLDILTFSVSRDYFEISINTPAQILPFKKAI
jgi:hypothetical protein